MSRSDLITSGIPTLVFTDAPAAPRDAFIEALSRQEATAAIAALAAGASGGAHTAWRSLAKTLIEEGKRYAQTPQGKRWARLLDDSPMVRNGWMVWNQANADFYVQNAAPLGDDPLGMLEESLRHLTKANLETLIGELSRLAVAAEADSAENHHHAHPAA